MLEEVNIDLLYNMPKILIKFNEKGNANDGQLFDDIMLEKFKLHCMSCVGSNEFECVQRSNQFKRTYIMTVYRF